MLLLQNGRVIDPKSGLDQVMDLVTGNGKILELGNDLKDSAKQSLQGLGSLNLSQEGNRTSVPDTAPRTFKRISYQKIKSSELNDYPIDNIEEMEQLL
mgnify:CR=1 FL=1